ncbi:MAG: enoyl-CoA hydratase [Planctomycetes bacterium]|nr:enoyl-CoA hydratase [Planctomycetota bacterium]
MSDSLILFNVKSSTAIITLNRSDKRNALSRGLIDAISEAFTRALNDDGVRCVVLAAAGSVFCAGMDLSELQQSIDLPPDQSPVWDDAYRLAKLYDQIYAMPKPTIALVQGAAVAGGAGLITVCDLAIAAPEAKFGYPEVRRGLVAAMVMPHLMRHVGERTARWLLLSGDLIDANEAARVGLINEVVPGDRLLDRALAMAKACAEGGPQALAKTKEYLRQFSHQSLSIEEAAKASAAPRLTQECQAGLRAFFAKKPAPWIQG